MSNNMLTGILGVALITLGACGAGKMEDVRGEIKRETIVFAPKATGRVLRIFVKEGHVAAPGDTLARLDVTVPRQPVAGSGQYIIATNYMSIEKISLHEGELAAAGTPVFSGYIPNSTWFRFTIPETKIVHFRKGNAVNIMVLYNKQEYTGTIQTIKQMPRYAGIATSTQGDITDDTVYEVKVAPLDVKKAEPLPHNATILLKERPAVI